MKECLLSILFLVILVSSQYANANCPLVSNGEMRPVGTVIYNSDFSVLQGCAPNGTWHALGAVRSSSPQNCPNIGDTCDDGTIYAGVSPDGNVRMYTTPADAASLYTWNDGSSNWVDTAMANCTDASPGTAATCQTGEANTALLVGLSGSGTPAPYDAAEYCDGLSAHGYDDWYLPAQDELNMLYTNKNTGDLNGTFDESGSFPAGYYWSSSEHSNSNARVQRFSDGFQLIVFKGNGLAVRCVRR